MKTGNLFVGNLSWNVTADDLHRTFDPYGNVVTARIIFDRETGRSKGFGFVEYATEADAERARQRLDGTPLDGRPLRINAAEDRRRA